MTVDPDIAEIVRQQAEAVRAAIRARDEAILAARRRGGSLREVAELAGLSHQTIKNIEKGAEQ